MKWSRSSCLTLCDPMDCSLPGSLVHGIFQAWILEWVAIAFSSGSSWPRDRTRVSHIVGRCFTLWATREATNLDSILKSRDITLPTKVHLVKAMVFPVVKYACESWTLKKLNAKELMPFNCRVREDSWESLVLQGDPTCQSSRKSVLNIHWKDWC